MACGLMGLSYATYWEQFAFITDSIELKHCLIKGAVFGLILAWVACFFGFNARGGARSVGEATRTTVVVSFLVILLSDYILTSLLPFGWASLKSGRLVSMSSYESSFKTKFMVGMFTLLGLALIFAVTIYVNDKPYWWRSCNYFFINLEDASGIKSKSPVKSRGLEVGYIDWVELTEDYVELGICLTAPVRALPTTRAYVKGEGFLGDKYIDLKPLEYTGRKQNPQSETQPDKREDSSFFPAQKRGYPLHPGGKDGWSFKRFIGAVFSLWISDAEAAQSQAKPPGKKVTSSRRSGPKGARQIPVGSTSQDVQQLVDEVDALVGELTVLTNNLKSVMDPEEMQRTMKQLSVTLEHASKTLSPEGNLTTTAQRVLVKLEAAVEQLQDQMIKVNQGEGSVGKILNDERYADQLEDALTSLNQLLGGVAGMRFMVDVGGESVPGLDRSRGWFQLGIWPQRDRYYLLGVGVDPRGKISTTTIETTSGSTTSSVSQSKARAQCLCLNRHARESLLATAGAESRSFSWGCHRWPRLVDGSSGLGKSAFGSMPLFILP